MAIQGVMQQIPLEDSERIEKVLASLNRPQDRMNATSQLVSTHAWKDLEGTLKFIENIENPRIKDQAYQSIMHA